MMQRRRLRLVLWICVGALVLLVVVLALLYQAVRTVPSDYEEALKLEPDVLREGSDEMLRQTSALVSDVRRGGRWEAWFSEVQINGWLAVDLAENHPGTLPDWLRDPRVKIAPEGVSMFGTLKRGDSRTVVTLTVEPYVVESNVVALRLRAARAGLLPLPMGEVTAGITEVARRAEVRLSWQQAEADPVALVHAPEPHDGDGKLVEIERLELGDGRLYVAGRTVEARDE